MRNPGTLFVSSERVDKFRRIWYVYLQGFGSSRTAVSSHVDKPYAETMLKKLKDLFKFQLKEYDRLDRQKLVMNMIDYISDRKTEYGVR